ncbi:MAG: hypothetical protein ACK52V_04640 [Betaproteobacteria bacterium]
MATSTITWHPVAEQLPDDDLLVLLSGGDAAMGFLDGDSWRDETAMPIQAPAWWAYFPPGPEAAS